MIIEFPEKQNEFKLKSTTDDNLKLFDVQRTDGIENIKFGDPTGGLCWAVDEEEAINIVYQADCRLRKQVSKNMLVAILEDPKERQGRLSKIFGCDCSSMERMVMLTCKTLRDYIESNICKTCVYNKDTELKMNKRYCYDCINHTINPYVKKTDKYVPTREFIGYTPYIQINDKILSEDTYISKETAELKLQDLMVKYKDINASFGIKNTKIKSY